MKIISDKIKQYKKLSVIKVKKNIFKSKINKDKLINFSSIKKNYVVIKVKYSNLNFKDCLIAKGHKGLVKKYPHTPGIDVAGKIYFSKSKKFKKKDNVFIIAKPFGVETNGGFSEFVIVHDSWVKKLPEGLSLKSSMLIGTSGFTALKAFEISKKIIKKFPDKSILITAPTSNVGLFLIFLLKDYHSKLDVVVSKSTNIKKLKKLGIKKTYLTENFTKKFNFPLLNEKYSVVFDNLGGQILSVSLKYLIKKGILISIGNILNNKSKINILSFILRESKIIGINAENSTKLEWNNFNKFLKNQKITNKIEKFSDTINLIKLKKILNKKSIVKKSYRYLIKI
jgi:acrylyl-CoA reductase (NADPH)